MRRLLPMVVVTCALAACGEPGPPAPCAPLEELGRDLPGFPAPEAPGLLGPALRSSGDGVIVDPRPHLRGEHPALALSRAAGCTATLTPIAAAPLAPEPAERSLGNPLPDRRFAALVVLSDPRDLQTTGATWDTIADLVGASGTALIGPTRARFEQALADTLGQTAAGGVALVALVGDGTTAGPGFVLGTREGTPEVASYQRVLDLIEAHGAHLGLVALYLDASHAGALVVPASYSPALLVVRASDRFAPWAPRLEYDGAGALGPALRERLGAELDGRCLASEGHADRPPPTDPGEVAALLVASADLRATILRQRWQALGVPALARLAARLELTPTTRDALAATLERQVPRELALLPRVLPDAAACESDRDCARGSLDPCEAWACELGQCVKRPVLEGGCDDGNPCTSGDVCTTRGCAGEVITCDDGNPCTDEACEPGRGCVPTPRPGEACDDGDPCTLGDACDAAGVCRGEGLVCDDGDPCTVDTCEPASADGPGGCTYVARNGLACDDGDPCTLGDQCRDRVCAGARRTCSDDNPCTTDFCDSATGQCAATAMADLVSCDDEDPCTRFDRCEGGLCVGVAASCDDGVACTFDRCTLGVCEHLPAPGTCLAETGCVAVGESPPDLPCLTCAATGVLAPTNEGARCGEDGLTCTADTCLDGRCVQVPAPDACRDAKGGCVAAGERAAPCLVCQGGGIVRPEPSQTPCGGPSDCAFGRCDGLGTCALPEPLPCCPVQQLACGESWLLAAPAVTDLPSRVDAWACADTPTPGPERWLRVAAPCAGTFTATLTALTPGAGAAALVLGAAPCRPGAPATDCLAVGPEHTLEVEADALIDLAVEAPPRLGRTDRWLVTTRCECAPEPAP